MMRFRILVYKTMPTNKQKYRTALNVYKQKVSIYIENVIHFTQLQFSRICLNKSYKNHLDNVHFNHLMPESFGKSMYWPFLSSYASVPA